MRIALCRFNPTVGAVERNAEAMIAAARRAAGEGADLIVFSELAVCGYPPRDLLFEEGFVERCEHAAAEVGLGAAGDGSRSPTVIVGTPARCDRGTRITNTLLAFRGGERVVRYDKRLLPTYDVFDEDRYFEPGDRAVVVEVPAGDGRRWRVGLSICEDLWQGADAGQADRYPRERSHGGAGAPADGGSEASPLAELVAAGAELIVSASASPFVRGKARRHRELLARHASTLRVPVASVNQLGANDDLIFDGAAEVWGPDGAIAAGAEFEDGPVLVDLNGANRVHPALDDDQAIFRALTLGVRDYVRKTGFREACIGLSGGIDSALTAVIAAAALGPEGVLGVSLPSRYSSEHSRSDAEALAENLGIRMLRVPIEAAHAGLGAVADDAFGQLGEPRLGEVRPDLADENLQSRIRGTTMMAIANRRNALVLTTGNKSEYAVGYATLYGDMNGALAVLMDLPKTRVYTVSRWVNEHHAALGFRVPPIPEGTLTKPPSAELAPGQKDEDSLPPYERLDRMIELLVERRRTPESVIAETGYAEDEVRRVARLIRINEYKRRQAAIGLKVTSVAFGPGRRYPVARG